MKQTDRNANTESPVPPGVDAVFLITCKDVVMGRGSGTQNHCGNVTYRKLVYLNKVRHRLFGSCWLSWFLLDTYLLK